MSETHQPRLWREIPKPQRKGDYKGKFVKFLVDSSNERGGVIRKPSLIKAGAIAQVMDRDKYGHVAIHGSYPFNSVLFKDDADRVLIVSWQCPHCDTPHKEGLPESWIDEGKLVFVEMAEDGVKKSA